jgi:ABC-2 type transport system ATP-binding protein
VIETRGLLKRYGHLVAVDGLDLSLKPGEVYGFLGPNGAGKTSTLKMLAGLMSPDGGSIRIAGVDMIARPQEAKAHLAYIPDRPALFPELTGRETLRLVAGLYGMEPGAAEARGEELLASFGLAAWGDERTAAYSHGMRQKLCFAAALLHRPQVLILDEPMVGLDPQGGRQIKELLRSLAAQGVTVFLSLHTLEIAEKLCDRLGILHHGRLLLEGTVEEIEAASGTRQDLEGAFLSLTQEGAPGAGGGVA